MAYNDRNDQDYFFSVSVKKRIFTIGCCKSGAKFSHRRSSQAEYLISKLVET